MKTMQQTPMKKILVISGKGGTGKTTVSASLIRLLHARAFADCDVDAPNLHLIHGFADQPAETPFVGAEKAEIDPLKCVGCGACARHCRFDAVRREHDRYRIVDHACEGCGVCAYVCPADAIRMKDDVAGKIHLYQDRNENPDEIRTFSTAELKMGRGNSGKLVTEVKNKLFASVHDVPLAILDGSPGVGCPVMASLNGVDLALIVTEPTLSGQSDLERIATTVLRACVPAAVIINKYDVNEDMSRQLEDWCAENQLPVIGKIPYDRRAGEAINQGICLVDTDGPAAGALRGICARVAERIGTGGEAL